MSSEEFSLDPSDDESAALVLEFDPEIYTAIENGELPSLKWKPKGYRPPTPAPEENPTDEPTANESAPDEEDKSFFDFDAGEGDDVKSYQMRRESGASLKGSAKKKTTNLSDVLNKMKKQLIDGNKD